MGVVRVREERLSCRYASSHAVASTGAALLSNHWLGCLGVIVSKIEAQPCQARRSAVAQQETPETRHALDSEIATDARCLVGVPFSPSPSQRAGFAYDCGDKTTKTGVK